MATSQVEPPSLHRDSPSPELRPTHALGGPAATREPPSRSVSAASSASHASATTDASRPRESLGSFVSASDASSVGGFSRHSSASFQSSSNRSSSVGLQAGRSSGSRHSTMSLDRQSSGSSGQSKRRGYMRPTGTDFAASAKQRESVLSLGSITHLQYYFARTGLLDGKGGQLARKRNLKAQTLDFSQLDSSSFLQAPGKPGGSDVDSSYASMGSSPDLGGQGGFMVESPIQDGDDSDYSDDFDGVDPGMLPPTASTYIHREKPVPKPPTTQELRSELTTALDVASKSLAEARTSSEKQQQPHSPQPSVSGPELRIEDPSDAAAGSPVAGAPRSPARGWHEIQGVHILDVMTLAIRAAKVYYTGHDHPDRLDTIKSEKVVRAELLAVMDVLKRMATRNFAGGMRVEEFVAMEGWVSSVRQMLRDEAEVAAQERAERASWTWLRDADWSDPSRAVEREYAFIQSMLAGPPSPISPSSGSFLPFPGKSEARSLSSTSTTPTAATFAAAAAAASLDGGASSAIDEEEEPLPPLPPWEPIDRAAPLESQSLPTPFLKSMQNGLALVRLHNAAVRKSQRRFGAIASYHIDTQKPYRCADNLRYWAKASELRWELPLRGFDALAVVYDNSGPQTWLTFEDAILKWCRKVREEIAAELVATGLV